ncbi:N-methylhydantoinase A/oxoprolinase/acetone carboxylase beta subunit [Brevibacillus nitrificans]|nr:N-methylhydantoinase A/oxoprolinase/acetone carboxylase beta subunit [Brevibacillus nitrificans]
MTADYALKFPVLTIASGPTNSVRGASFLCGIEDALVPRESSLVAQIGDAQKVAHLPAEDVQQVYQKMTVMVEEAIDRIYANETRTREEILEDCQQLAIAEAVRAGALPETVTIVDIEEVPLAYLSGNAVRMRAKAVGELFPATGRATRE